MASNELGVMQGRLLPKYLGRYQAHPIGYWDEEFAVAAGLGLELVEFILDYNDWQLNPLMNDEGLRAIETVAEATGVRVKSICADYFMEAPLHSRDEKVVDASLAVLRTLIGNARRLGVKNVVIPCVDQSSIRNDEQERRFVEAIRAVAPLAREGDLFLSLETDLPPSRFAALLERIDSPQVSVNYDTGNSASLGFDPVEELAAYGPLITDIHIKDRVRGGGSIKLGLGDTQFKPFFKALEALDYKGPFIMQAYRDDEGVKVFKEQLAWIRDWLTPWCGVPRS